MEHHRIIDWKQLDELVPYTKQHILRLEKEGKFPGRLKLGANRVGWRLIEILEWMQEKQQERDLQSGCSSKPIYQDRIIRDPRKFEGNPFIKDAFIPVHHIIKLILAGMSLVEIQAIHNSLTYEDVAACFDYINQVSSSVLDTS